MSGVEGFDGEGLKQRSPSFPYISLDLAIERVKIIYKNIRDTPQPREQVAKAYGKTASSSATVQTFATLIQYGLLENVVINGSRRLKVTNLAKTIVHPNAPKEQVSESIKKAAFIPSIFRELWNLYKNIEDISDDVPLFYLTHDRENVHGGVFTERAAQDVLRIYRATLAFAGIAHSGGYQNNVDDVEEWEGANPHKNQAVDARAQLGSEPLGDRLPHVAVESRRIDLASGEREIQTGMLSKTATYRIIVSGNIGKKEIEMLIKKLEIDKDLFGDSDEELSNSGD